MDKELQKASDTLAQMFERLYKANSLDWSKVLQNEAESIVMNIFEAARNSALDQVSEHERSNYHNS